MPSSVLAVPHRFVSGVQNVGVGEFGGLKNVGYKCGRSIDVALWQKSVVCQAQRAGNGASQKFLFHRLCMAGRFLVFDLDGTLSDPLEGFVRSINYALEAYGYPLQQASVLSQYVCPPLENTPRTLIGT